MRNHTPCAPAAPPRRGERRRAPSVTDPPTGGNVFYRTKARIGRAAAAGKTIHGTAKKGTGANITKGGRARAGKNERTAETLSRKAYLLKAFYVIEHKILKIEHRFYHFRVTKPKMWDNVQSDSFLEHFCLENRNPCYYTGYPKGTKKRWHRHLKNRTLIFEAPGTRENRVARPFDSSAAGGGLSP